jgi:hypothetical protein
MTESRILQLVALIGSLIGIGLLHYAVYRAIKNVEDYEHKLMNK